MIDIVKNFLEKDSLNELVFYPRKYKIDESFEIDCNGIKLHCSYFPTSNHRRTVIFFYGNGECALDYIPSFPLAFKKMRCNLLIAEYRGYGMSEGMPTIPLIMQDIHSIIDALNIPETEIILYGRSLGIFPVISGIENFPNISGIILDSCYASPIEFLDKRLNHKMSKELKGAMLEYFKFRETSQSFKGPALILHSVYDDLVPFQNAKIFKDSYFRDCRLIAFSRGSHNTLLLYNKKQYLKEVSDFIRRISLQINET